MRLSAGCKRGIELDLLDSAGRHLVAPGRRLALVDHQKARCHGIGAGWSGDLDVDAGLRWLERNVHRPVTAEQRQQMERRQAKTAARKAAPGQKSGSGLDIDAETARAAAGPPWRHPPDDGADPGEQNPSRLTEQERALSWNLRRGHQRRSRRRWADSMRR